MIHKYPRNILLILYFFIRKSAIFRLKNHLYIKNFILQPPEKVYESYTLEN